MSALMYFDGATIDVPIVRYFEAWDRPAVVVGIGHGSVFLDPGTARQLAADIVASLPISRGAGWSKGITAGIADAVRRLRRSRQITAQSLADRTAELAFPISRATVTALETGRRESVTVQELLVLAEALGVAPWDLIPRSAPAPCPDCALGACTVDHGGVA